MAKVKEVKCPVCSTGLKVNKVSMAGKPIVPVHAFGDKFEICNGSETDANEILYVFDPFGGPKKQGTSSRSSTHSNMCVQEALLDGDLSIKGRIIVLSLLGMYKNDKARCRCAYCGCDKSLTWDHFYPIVKDRRATGYINENNNLVPACGPCNSSKGPKTWKELMKVLKGPGHEERFKRLEAVDALKREKVDYSKSRMYNPFWALADGAQRYHLDIAKAGMMLKADIINNHRPDMKQFNSVHIPEDMPTINSDDGSDETFEQYLTRHSILLDSQKVVPIHVCTTALAMLDCGLLTSEIANP